MATLPNANRAYVNCSSTHIPFYQNNVQVGTIAPNDMYTTSYLPGASESFIYIPATARINSVRATGHIQRGPQPWAEAPAWLAEQVYFHRKNSNGTTLVEPTRITLDGSTYMVFTVKKSVGIYNGATHARDLTVGTRIATDGSTVGETYPYRISIDYVEENGKWVKRDGFWVDLGFAYGSGPSDRALW